MAEAAAARSFDPQEVAGRKIAFALAGEWDSVVEVAAGGAVLAPVAAARLMPAALADQREAHRRQCFELAHDPIAAAVLALAAAAAAQRELANAQRILA